MTESCKLCQLPHAGEPGDVIACLQATQAALRALLKHIGDPAECRDCRAPIIWVTHKNGKKAPYTAAGLNHFADCPAAENFRKAKS